jgi:hypothetical protein
MINKQSEASNTFDKNFIENDLNDIQQIQKISLDLNDSNLEHDINAFLSISKKVKIELLPREYDTLCTLLKDFILKIIEKILLNLVYDTITIQYKEALKEAMLILSTEKNFSSQMRNRFSYDENFIEFSIFIDSKYSPSDYLEVTIIIIMKIKLHRKYCKITVDIKSFEIIYKVKEKFGMKLNPNNSSEILLDKKNSKCLIKQINLMQKLNNNNPIRFYIEYPIKEIDVLRICFNNLIFNKNKLKPRKFPKQISKEGYIYMMATKNPMNFGCQNCLNENNEKIFQVKFREFEQHNCRIHLCKTCVDLLCSDDCITDCLSCDDFLMNFNQVDKIYHYHLINQLKK